VGFLYATLPLLARPEPEMLRIIVVLLALASPAFAQVMDDKAIQEQLVPESFKLEASATAAKADLFNWRTTISYAITNNSGMNLYMGVMMNSASIGSCTEIRSAHGGLALLPGPNAIAYGVDLSVGPPRATYVPAGARVAGTLAAEDCPAPNPGSPKAPFSFTLMIGQTDAQKTMVQVPLSTEASIRRIREE
jgi:hypothetical protein